MAHRTDAGASGETELVLAIPGDKEEDEVKVKSQRAQKGFFASGHIIGVKSEKSENLEYLAVINYEILEYMFWNKDNCHIKFSPNG